MAIGTPTFVAQNFTSNSTNTLVVSGVTAAVGDLLILFTGNDGSQAVASGVTDSAGNTWQADHAGLRSTDQYNVRVFSTVVTSALSSGTVTISYAGSTGTWDRYGAIWKVTGSWDANRVDKTSGATGSGSTYDSGLTATTTVADELVIGVGQRNLGNNSGAVSATPGAGLTELRDDDTGNYVHYAVDYKIVSSTGTYKVDGTWVGLTPSAWASIVVTYKEAASGGSPQNVSVTGLGSASAFGSVTAIPGNRNVGVSALASAASFGTPTIAVGGVTVTPDSLASASALGGVSTLPGGVTVSVTGLGSAAAFGTPGATAGGLIVQPAGLGSAAAFGSPTPVPGGTVVSVTGLGSASQLGSPTIRSNRTVAVSGLGSASAFGTVGIATGGTVVQVAGLNSASQFGGVTTDGGVGPTFHPAIHGGKHR